MKPLCYLNFISLAKPQNVKVNGNAERLSFCKRDNNNCFSSIWNFSEMISFKDKNGSFGRKKANVSLRIISLERVTVPLYMIHKVLH